MVRSNIKSAILKTLKYSDYFHYPLTFDELYARLVGIKTSRATLKSDLEQLVFTNKVIKTSKFYTLKSKENNIKQRQIYEQLSAPLRRYVISLLPTLIKIKTIRGIFLTGSLAMNNTDGHDDIDLMIITEPKKLWTTRLILTIYTTILGLRRSRVTQNIAGKLCLNLYLTPDSLSVPLHLRSLYTAYELIQAVPLYDPHNLHAQLLHSNLWINDFLPNFSIQKRDTKIYGFTDLSAQAGLGIYDRLLESIVYQLQYLYMQSRVTREYITKDSAYFHPNNPGSKVLRKLNI